LSPLGSGADARSNNFKVTGEQMSAEYRPVKDLPFHLLDHRLEEYGISVDRQGPITCLIGPHGVLVARPEGKSTHFERSLGVDTQAVLDALAVEYGIEIVDENDYRFWGFASHAEMLEACGDPEPSPPSWVLAEGPSLGDAQFAIAWLQAAIDADQMLQLHFERNPALRKSLYRLESEYTIQFVPAAMAFVGMWRMGQGIFSVNLFDSEWAEIFSIMAAVGFFTQTGHRYQMTIPGVPTVDVIVNALHPLAATEDQETFLHPERLLVTMTEQETVRWKGRLESMNWQQRLADRDALLAD
jgi:hypothetical protein